MQYCLALLDDVRPNYLSDDAAHFLSAVLGEDPRARGGALALSLLRPTLLLAALQVYRWAGFGVQGIGVWSHPTEEVHRCPGEQGRGEGGEAIPHPAPCTLHPAPCTPHPAPRTLHPAPRSPHSIPLVNPHLAPLISKPAPRALD